MHTEPAANIAKPPAARKALDAPEALEETFETLEDTFEKLRRQRAIRVARAPFRLHTNEDEPPPAGHVFALAAWAAISIFVGLIPTVRLVVSLVLKTGAWWYPIAATSAGLLGLALVTAAFGAIHRARLPWVLMTIATLLLAANVAMVYINP